MSDTNTATSIEQQSDVQTQQETINNNDLNQSLASSLWGVPQEVKAADASAINNETAVNNIVEEVNNTQTTEEEFQTIDLDEYFKKEFGRDAATAKAEWESLQKIKETSSQQEIQFANEDSKRFFDSLKEGKEDDIYAFLSQKRQIERLEKLNVDNINDAKDILKTSLQFKNKNISKEDIDFMVEDNYYKPLKPIKSVDEEDDDYAVRVQQWEQQVQRIDRKMIIDAKLAQNDISSYKSQIVLPDIPKTSNDSQLNQKELEEQQQKMAEVYQNFRKALDGNYKNFKGFDVTAKDGDVQLPINYSIPSEELELSKQQLESFDLYAYMDKRWFDENQNPNILQMQKDLYVLENLDRILQSVASEAASKRYLHHMKSQNNINLSGVNPNLSSPVQGSQKTENQVLAEHIWKM